MTRATIFRSTRQASSALAVALALLLFGQLAPVHDEGDSLATPAAESQTVFLSVHDGASKDDAHLDPAAGYQTSDCPACQLVNSHRFVISQKIAGNRHGPESEAIHRPELVPRRLTSASSLHPRAPPRR